MIIKNIRKVCKKITCVNIIANKNLITGMIQNLNEILKNAIDIKNCSPEKQIFLDKFKKIISVGNLNNMTPNKYYSIKNQSTFLNYFLFINKEK